MRKRRKVVILLNIASVCILAVQISYLTRAPTKPNTSTRLTDHSRLHLTLGMIEWFQDAASEFDIHPIVVDPWLLRKLEERGGSDDKQRDTLPEGNADNYSGSSGTKFTITLAIIRHEHTQLDKWVGSLRLWSCDITYDTLPMYVMLDWSAQVITHARCHHHHRHASSPLVISVVVMYDHPSGGYLWFTTPTEGGAQRQYVVNRFAVLPRYVSVGDSSHIYPLHLPTPTSTYQPHVFTPCNYTRAAHFYRSHQHGEETDTGEDLMHDFKGAHFKQAAKQLISESSGILDDLNIPFWISSGTCLGWYRQCDIIGHSGDVDLGIFIQHYKPQLISRFKASAFNLLHIMGKVSDSLQISFSKNGVKFDIYFFYTEHGGDGERRRETVWNGATDGSTLEKFKYVFSPFTLCHTELLGALVRVPCNTHQYVLDNYGPDWFEERKLWDWKLSPPNSRANGKWQSEELEHVLRIF